jgi:hypothetical protein
MGGIASSRRGQPGTNKSTEAMRLSDIQLASLLKRLQISKDRQQTRIDQCNQTLQAVCNASMKSGLSEDRRKRAFKNVLIAEQRFNQLCNEIDLVEQERAGIQEIGTLIEIQSATGSAMTGLQANAPEIFATDSTSSIRQVHNFVVKYWSVH